MSAEAVHVKPVPFFVATLAFTCKLIGAVHQLVRMKSHIQVHARLQIQVFELLLPTHIEVIWCLAWV